MNHREVVIEVEMYNGPSARSIGLSVSIKNTWMNFNCASSHPHLNLHSWAVQGDK
jgi:hypothetical protein